ASRPSRSWWRAISRSRPAIATSCPTPRSCSEHTPQEDSMQLQFLGATGTVTGSKYLLRHEGATLLVDCGLFQGYKQLRLRNWAPMPVPAAGIDAIVLTHAHIDHSGYVQIGRAHV